MTVDPLSVDCPTCLVPIAEMCVGQQLPDDWTPGPRSVADIPTLVHTTRLVAAGG